MKRLAPFIFIFFVVVIFFSQFIFQNKLPIPSDTITGLYHPFRDLYAKDYPNGVAYKNFLITDPVRQQIPWRRMSVDAGKRFELPLWNPYNFSGTPLLANFQSGAFYPFNLLLFILPFSYGWSILILLQPLMSGIFLYLYLSNLKINRSASLIGSISFAFSGFSTSWLEWGTIGHTALWLPLVLLSIDKIMFTASVLKISNFKSLISNKKIVTWNFVFLISLVSSFFAGHVQTFFYLFLIFTAYFLARWWQKGKPKKILFAFLFLFSLFLLVTTIQWIPTLQFINQSARGIDQTWLKDGWFIPWQNIIQFLAPDFFGNPTTLNYWGVWNYAEFVGYVGIFPLIMAFFALFYRHDKKTLFFGTVFFLSLIFSFPTIFAKIPYILQIPLLSTSQPTRLLFLTDFSLAVLAAFGSDALIRRYKTKKLIYVLLILALTFGGLWIFVLSAGTGIGIAADALHVAKRNLILPTILFFTSIILIFLWVILQKKRISAVVLYAIIAMVIFDLFRFNNKFTPFTKKEYLFPSSKTIEFLQKQKGEFRIMTTDDRILPPNFSGIYHLQMLDGYDPLYLLKYAELIVAIKRDKPDISKPFGFNRIITSHNFESRFMDLMGVRFVLSLTEINSPKLEKVFEEGQTKVYENANSFGRAFFVENVIAAAYKEEAIRRMFDAEVDFRNTAIAEGFQSSRNSFTKGEINNVEYRDNQVLLEVKNAGEGFLVLMDSFYPTWKAEVCSIDLIECKEAKIYLTNYNFRGIIVPRGDHKVVFYTTLF